MYVMMMITMMIMIMITIIGLVEHTKAVTYGIIAVPLKLWWQMISFTFWPLLLWEVSHRDD
jgi:hypothetical protein